MTLFTAVSTKVCRRKSVVKPHATMPVSIMGSESLSWIDPSYLAETPWASIKQPTFSYQPYITTVVLDHQSNKGLKPQALFYSLLNDLIVAIEAFKATCMPYWETCRICQINPSPPTPRPQKKERKEKESYWLFGLVFYPFSGKLSDKIT